MIEHLSTSQIGMFSRCAEQYRRRYIEGQIMPPGIAGALGKGVHKGGEYNFRQKIESGVDLSAAEVAEFTVNAFEEIAHEGVFLAPEEVGAKVRLLNEARTTAHKLSHLMMAEVAPKVQPVAVEEKIIIAPAEIHPVTMWGVIDLAAVGDVVRDLKTSGVKWSDDKVGQQLQNFAYPKLYEHAFGRPLRSMWYDVLVKTKTPYAQALEAPIGEDCWEALMARAQHMLASVHAGNFIPADPGHWCCSPKWCGYWYSCQFIPASRRNTNAKTK